MFPGVFLFLISISMLRQQNIFYFSIIICHAVWFATTFYWIAFASSQPMRILAHIKSHFHPIVTCTLPIPIPIFSIFVFPFPWDSHGYPIPMHILNLNPVCYIVKFITSYTGWVNKNCTIMQDLLCVYFRLFYLFLIISLRLIYSTRCLQLSFLNMYNVFGRTEFAFSYCIIWKQNCAMVQFVVVNPQMRTFYPAPTYSPCCGMHRFHAQYHNVWEVYLSQ